MQRAAASESPKPLEEPMAKRQKLSNGSPRVLNSTSTFGDATAIRAALAAEEAKREEALSRQSRGDDETRWMFSFRAEERGQEEGLKVQKVGYAGLDAYRIEGEDSEELWKPDGEGRKIFGKYRRKESVSLKNGMPRKNTLFKCTENAVGSLQCRQAIALQS